MFNIKDYFEGREQERLSFVRRSLSSPFTLSLLAQDWGARRYFRVHEGTQSYVLMEAVPDHINAGLAGQKLSDFIRIANMLQKNGIRTPQILSADESEGFLLLEDMGDITVNTALERGDYPYTLYAKATDVLIVLRDKICPGMLDLPRYKDSHIRKGRQRIVDWYVPATRGERNSDSLLSSYLSAWNDVSAQLPPPSIGFIHGDYHPQNLMLLPDGSLGVLDFQDAMWGPVAYDLANLLENIRRDVPEDVYGAMLNRYGGDETFLAWFRVMATQFHCRILGQVLRMAIVGGKSDYLKYIPRVQNYIKKGLQDPVLKPLADWMRAEKIDLDASGCFSPDRVKPFIRDDAF